MKLNAAIFDMDGLLIDSEPCWEEAGKETLAEYGIRLSPDDYVLTTGLRTREWIDWWFTHFGIDKSFSKSAGDTIVDKAIQLIRDEAKVLPGVDHVFELFRQKGYKIGLATSSPVQLIKVVTEKLGIKDMLDGFSSAEELEHSKPHPEVYLNCATNLNVSPLQCICFEDSINGLISAKAARMKCVVVPTANLQADRRFGLADLQINSLLDFDDFHLDLLNGVSQRS